MTHTLIKSAGVAQTPAGEIPVVATRLGFADRLGAWKARWAVGRMDYSVEPGLYAVGAPTPESPVFMSANYKMSFDRLRSSLDGRDGWILVLDTKGINVWCAAGKGTFGTDEAAARIEATRLTETVSHRKLIVPQLGAPGVGAHEVKKRTGFTVHYGPVRAEDLPAYLDAGMQATPEMRRVTFPLWERLVLVPVELVMSAKYIVAVLALLFVLSGLGPGIYSASRAWTVGLRTGLLFLSACISGAVLAPALLPWLPGRAFSTKGAWAGMATAALLVTCPWMRSEAFVNPTGGAGWFLLIPAVSSFLAMQFTGASTYTSLSGVHRELRAALPAQGCAAALGLVLWIASLFL